MAYLSGPSCCFGRVVVVGAREISAVHDRAEGEAQLAANDLRVQRELFSCTSAADEAPDAVSEQFDDAKVHIVTGGRSCSGAAKRHQADVPVHGRRGRFIAACTVAQLTRLNLPRCRMVMLVQQCC